MSSPRNRHPLYTGHGYRTTARHVHLAGAQEPGLFWVVDSEHCLRLLCVGPRHGGNMAHEFAGRFAIPSLADDHKCLAAVLSFHLTCRSHLRFSQPAEAICRDLPLVSRCGWAACGLHLAEFGSPVCHPNLGFFCLGSVMRLTPLFGLRSFQRLSEKKNSLQRSPWAACR